MSGSPEFAPAQQQEKKILIWNFEETLLKQKDNKLEKDFWNWLLVVGILTFRIFLIVSTTVSTANKTFYFLRVEKLQNGKKTKLEKKPRPQDLSGWPTPDGRHRRGESHHRPDCEANIGLHQDPQPQEPSQWKDDCPRPDLGSCHRTSWGWLRPDDETASPAPGEFFILFFVLVNESD